MSTTNRAFIKAYRQDEPDPAPKGSALPASQNQLGRGPIGAPARDAAFASTTTVVRPALSNIEPQRTAAKRPLSSFMGLAKSPQAAPETDGANFVQPGTTVDSFQWPKTCRALGQQSGPQLDRVVDLFRAEAASGRSLIGIMGLFPRVGTTTTAMCLAVRAARRVQRAILVDGNFCHPRIAAWLDAVPTVGWEEVLKHAAPLADAVIRATDDNLDLLALGAKAAKDPQSLAAGLQAAVTAGVLRHAYDLVLVDLGTFFDPASQPIALELIRNMGLDSVAAVLGPEPADARDMATLSEYLEPTGCQLFGTIENRVAKSTS